MAEPSPIPQLNATDGEAAPVQNGTPVAPTQAVDVEMSDSTPAVQTPTHTQPPPTVPTPPHATAAVQTPTRNSPHPPAPVSAPTNPNPHGSPTRVYLNQNVTPHLLEAMKHLATTEPDKPLKWLSEFLAQKSRELEGP